MDISTDYLGLKLRSPLVPSAGPPTGDPDAIRRLADAGAAAVVLPSLFEEQIIHDQHELDRHLTFGTESFAESLTYFPEPDELFVGPEEYLALIERAKAAVDIPVIANLNGATPGGWTRYATQMESAGADAIELNIYQLPSDIDQSGAEVERGFLDVLQSVVAAVGIPVAIKLSPFFSNMANMAKRAVDHGAAALVLFNRFYQPDIDIEELEVYPHLVLSTSQEARLPLTWIGLLHGRLPVDFAATRGIHTVADVIKLIMVGANVTMMTSSLLTNGPEHLAALERELREWMSRFGYTSVKQMRGSMSRESCPDPTAYERAQYFKVLHSYRPPTRDPSL